MRIDAISIGKNPPEDINVIVEVPVGGHPIKYEMDKEAGTLVVDRFLYTPMTYPGNYGFVPHTLSDDGDPIDVLIASTRPLVPGCVINVRPIGVMMMEDNSGKDEKIIAVPNYHADQALRQGQGLHRPAGNHAAADRALLRALQGSGARQVGEDLRLEGCHRRTAADRRSDRTRQDSKVTAGGREGFPRILSAPPLIQPRGPASPRWERRGTCGSCHSIKQNLRIRLIRRFFVVSGSSLGFEGFEPFS